MAPMLPGSLATNSTTVAGLPCSTRIVTDGEPGFHSMMEQISLI